MRSDATARTMAALLHPLANCSEILVKETVTQYLSPCMDKAFRLVILTKFNSFCETKITLSSVSVIHKLLSVRFRLQRVFLADT